MKPIPYARQSIDESDIEAVVDVLRTDWITQGPKIEEFEREVRTYCGATHAAAVSSGTAALHLAYLALGLGPGDTLWTSPITFVATANCALYCGAEVDFVDVDPASGNLCVDALERKLEDARRRNRLPKIVAPVDFTGLPCDLASIRTLADRFGFSVVEDASHALGASYRGDRVGGGGYADITVLSFHPVKIITAGEGGMTLTDHGRIDATIKKLRSHGIERGAQLSQEHGAWYYEQDALGYNYRMTDIQAALGISQLQRIDGFLSRRRELAVRYADKLRRLPVIAPHQPDHARSSWHLYVIRIDDSDAPAKRRAVFDRLASSGIRANVHYIPVHLQPFYRARGFSPGMFPEAERYYRQALSLPLYAGMSDEDQDRVVLALEQALK